MLEYKHQCNPFFRMNWDPYFYAVQEIRFLVFHFTIMEKSLIVVQLVLYRLRDQRPPTTPQTTTPQGHITRVYGPIRLLYSNHVCRYSQWLSILLRDYLTLLVELVEILLVDILSLRVEISWQPLATALHVVAKSNMTRPLTLRVKLRSLRVELVIYTRRIKSGSHWPQ